MDNFLEFLRKTDLQNIIVYFLITWFFTRDIKKEMRSHKKNIDIRWKILNDKSDHLYEEFRVLLKEKNGGS